MTQLRKNVIFLRSEIEKLLGKQTMEKSFQLDFKSSNYGSCSLTRFLFFIAWTISSELFTFHPYWLLLSLLSRRQTNNRRYSHRYLQKWQDKRSQEDPTDRTFIIQNAPKWTLSAITYPRVRITVHMTDPIFGNCNS